MSAYGTVGTWAHRGSDWLRIKAIIWLQIDHQNTAGEGLHQPALTSSWKTYTLTVTSKPTATATATA